MSKSIKPSNNTYIDTTGIVHEHKLLSDILKDRDLKSKLLRFSTFQSPITVDMSNYNHGFILFSFIADGSTATCQKIYDFWKRNNDINMNLLSEKVINDNCNFSLSVDNFSFTITKKNWGGKVFVIFLGE